METDATVILVPVLRRPHRVKPFLESLAAVTDPSTDPYRVLFLCTERDAQQIRAVERAGAEAVIVGRHRPGDYARKINHGYRSTTEPYLFLGADDLFFFPGWLTNAKARLSATIHVVGTNDLGNQKVMEGLHATHSLVTRHYVDTYGTIDERGKVLCELYPHTFVDDEFIQTAISRSMFAHAPDSIVEHLHPHWRKAARDSTYAIADRSVHPGRRIFNRRRSLWLNPSR